MRACEMCGSLALQELGTLGGLVLHLRCRACGWDTATEITSADDQGDDDWVYDDTVRRSPISSFNTPPKGGC